MQSQSQSQKDGIVGCHLVRQDSIFQDKSNPRLPVVLQNGANTSDDDRDCKDLGRSEPSYWLREIISRCAKVGTQSQTKENRKKQIVRWNLQ